MSQYQVQVKLVQAWKNQMLEGAATVFTSATKTVSAKEADHQQAELDEQIGRLQMELEWLKKSVRLRVSGSDRRSTFTMWS